LIDFRRWSSANGLSQNSELDLVFNYDIFRDKFRREVKAGWLLLNHKSFVKYNKQVDNEQVLEENYFYSTDDQARFGPEKMLAQLLEKLYVELRLMTEYKDKSERRMSILIIVAMCMNYYVAFVTIYLGVLMRHLPWDMIAGASFCTVFPVMLIMNSAIMSHQVSL
jgi:hypothetical protein